MQYTCHNWFNRLLVCTALLLVSNVLCGQIIDQDDKEIKPLDKELTESKPSRVPIQGQNRPVDTIAPGNYAISADKLDCAIQYSADSSKYIQKTGVVELYGNAQVTYCEMNLTGDFINYNTETGLAEASGVKDEDGEITGYAEFTDGQQSVQYKKMAYNFKSKQGKLFQLVTEQGDGVVRAGEIKMVDNETFYGADAVYTSCNLEHPHYYFKFNKLKVAQDKLAAGTDMQLYIKDIPTPAYFPFGIFPLQQGRRSGFLRPQPGYDDVRGFNLENLGYYLAINDNMDLEARTSLYTSGSWRGRLNYSYKKRYKYSGNVDLTYNKNKNLNISNALGEDLNNSFQFRWNFSQDPKAWAYSNFNASVSFGQSNFKTLNVYNPTQRLNNNYTSSINYTKTFPEFPLNISSSIRYNQNTSTNVIGLSLPNVNLSTPTLYPFRKLAKPGNSSGLLNTLTMSYASNFKNDITTIDSVFFNDPLSQLGDGRYGASHRIPVSTSFNIAQFFRFSPQMTYNEVWTSETIRKDWDDSNADPNLHRQVIDTVKEFRTARWYTPSIGFNTKIFGFKEFNKGKINAIRHVLTPSVNLSYNPDFTKGGGDKPWFQEAQYNTAGDTENYSVFERNLFSGPPVNSGGSLGFNLANNLEMKVRSKKDSTGLSKIKIFENLNFSTSLDLGADSLKWRPVSFSGNTRLFNKLGVNMGGSFNPYSVDPTSGRRVDRAFYKDNTGLLDLTNFRFTLTGSLNGNKAEEGAPQQSQLIPNPVYPGEQLLAENYSRSYIDFSIPWDLNLTYNFNWRKNYLPNNGRSFNRTQSITGGGRVNLSENWNVGFNSGYDIINNEVNYTRIQVTRDLHCWQMGFDWSPVGQYKRYFFTISPKSNLLRGLKLDKERTYLDNFD